jgi:histidyl-tRNA synthetase
MTESIKKQIYRPRPVSGFPELLPEWRAVQLQWLDKIRAVFESFGFCSIETPSVEELAALGSKGEVDKEVYVIERLHADGDEEARLALHYDLTVPFARYTAQHFNDLVFPFKRYQMQKVWRGERPQLGREREFMQCDVDVINIDSLPLHFDAEILLMVCAAIKAIGIEGVQLHISHRKILEGYLTGLGFPDYVAAIRILDKIEKISRDELILALAMQLTIALPEGTGLSSHEATELAQQAVKLAEIKSSDTSFVAQVRALGVEHPVLDEGLIELEFIIERLQAQHPEMILADLAIARGLDYYTGMVVEGKLASMPRAGSVVAGGRYADLAGSYINKNLPGVGVSLGITRLFSLLMESGQLQPGPRSPAQVLVVLWSEDQRAATEALATTLRQRGINTEMYHAPQKISRQLSYAEKKGIPYVWFPPQEAGQNHEVKTMATGEQVVAEVGSWQCGYLVF